MYGTRHILYPPELYESILYLALHYPYHHQPTVQSLPNHPSVLTLLQPIRSPYFTLHEAYGNE